MPGLLVPHHLLEFARIRVHCTGDALYSFCPWSFPAPGNFPVSVVCIRWPKYWSFSFSITPCSEYSGLICLRNDWFDLLAVQGTFRSLLQHHSVKASIICPSAFTFQLSQPYMTTGKTISLITDHTPFRVIFIALFYSKCSPLLSLRLSLAALYTEHLFKYIPQWLSGKNPPTNAGDKGLMPGLGRPPGEGMAAHFGILAWKSHGQRNLQSTVHRMAKESDMTKQQLFK